MQGLLIKFILFLVLGTSMGCSMIAKWVAEEPELRLSSISFEEMNLNRVKLAFTIEVNNPNDFELGLDRVDYKVFVAEKVIGQGTFNGQFRVGAREISSLRIPFTLDPKAAFKVAQSYFSKRGKLEALVTGKSLFVTPIGGYEVDFSERKLIIKP